MNEGSSVLRKNIVTSIRYYYTTNLYKGFHFQCLFSNIKDQELKPNELNQR